jgi:glutamine cyclotransferase
LIYVDGHLYESTGINGRSSLRMDELESGRVLQRHELPAEYFAEGLTNWGGTLIQLTWQTHTAFVYDRFSFRLLRTFHYEGEGWGLTQDRKQLVLSNGSSTLRFLNPSTFQDARRISVTYKGVPVTQLNELEYIHGEIYANL